MGNETDIAKDYLGQIKKIDSLINNKIKEREQWFELATSCTAKLGDDKVQSSGSQQKMADAMHRCMEIDKEIEKYIDELIDKKLEIINTIEKLPEKEYDVLHKIYIQELSFDETAESMKPPKSRSWVNSKHGIALQLLAELLVSQENI